VCTGELLVVLGEDSLLEGQSNLLLLPCLQFQEQCKIFSVKGCAILPVGAIVKSL